MTAPRRQINALALSVLMCSCALLLIGCSPGGGFTGGSVKAPPRGRVGRYASTSLGTFFMDANNIGRHGYSTGWAEKNGIVYTCKAGHVDIAHLRKAADWTAYTAANILNQLEKNRTEFTFRLKEASRHHVKLKYPEWWKDLPEDERSRIRKDVAVGLGQYFAYIGGVWHEMITWFGYRSTGIYPEFPSAFAWEDSFSDLFGTTMGARALRDTDHEYDEALTLAINRELAGLGPQTGKTARKASDSVRGLWFSGDFLFLMDMKARNFDIGMDDGKITPWLVPYLAECEGAQAQPYPAPNFDFLDEYGFEIQYEFEPREKQGKRILKKVFEKESKKRIVPSVHFPEIIEYIRNDAIVNHNSYVEGNFTTLAPMDPEEPPENIREPSSQKNTGRTDSNESAPDKSNKNKKTASKPEDKNQPPESPQPPHEP